MNKIGSINIENVEIGLFAEISDLEKLKAKLAIETTEPTTEIPVPTIPVTEAPKPTKGLTISNTNSGDCVNGKKRISFKVENGSGKYDIGIGGAVYAFVGFFEMNANSDWTINIIDKETGQKLQVRIKSNDCGVKADFLFEALEKPAKVETINTDDFAQIGVPYKATPKVLLHLSRYEADRLAQKYTCKINGKELFSIDTQDGYYPNDVYIGNHPVELLIPVLGQVDFEFTNTTKTNDNIIWGLMKDKSKSYLMYDKDGLNQSEYHKTLKPNESDAKGFNLNYSQFGLNENGRYSLICPVYENGKLSASRTNQNGSDYGRGNTFIMPNSEAVVNIYKLADPNKMIKIRVKTFSIGETPTFQVIEKNGLDINPNHVSINCYQPEYYKLFNNRSTGYKDSPDYKEA